MNDTLNLQPKKPAPRFALPLDVELQKQDQPASAWTAESLREVSVQGFYFFSDVRYQPGTLFKFSIPLQRGQATGGKLLLSGIASIIRCEELDRSQGIAAFGVVARIEEATP